MGGDQFGVGSLLALQVLHTPFFYLRGYGHVHENEPGWKIVAAGFHSSHGVICRDGEKDNSGRGEHVAIHHAAQERLSKKRVVLLCRRSCSLLRARSDDDRHTRQSKAKRQPLSFYSCSSQEPDGLVHTSPKIPQFPLIDSQWMKWMNLARHSRNQNLFHCAVWSAAACLACCRLSSRGVCSESVKAQASLRTPKKSPKNVGKILGGLQRIFGLVVQRGHPSVTSGPNRPTSHLSLIVFDRQVWSSAFRLHCRSSLTVAPQLGRQDK